MTKIDLEFKRKVHFWGQGERYIFWANDVYEVETDLEYNIIEIGRFTKNDGELIINLDDGAKKEIQQALEQQYKDNNQQ